MEEPIAPLRRLVRPSTLSEQAYERIRTELLPGGSLSDASRLVERELAEWLSMSRTPVRDALSRLALAGIVEPIPGGGYVRRTITLREMQEHFELRILLESVAARMAATRWRDDLDPLAVDGGTTRPQPPFHVALAQASGNSVLSGIIATLTERLANQYEFGDLSPEDAEALAAGHRQLVEALRRRDADDAESTVREHLLLASRLVTKRLRHREEPA